MRRSCQVALFNSLVAIDLLLLARTEPKTLRHAPSSLSRWNKTILRVAQLVYQTTPLPVAEKMTIYCWLCEHVWTCSSSKRAPTPVYRKSCAFLCAHLIKGPGHRPSADFPTGCKSCRLSESQQRWAEPDGWHLLLPALPTAAHKVTQGAHMDNGEC